MRIEPNQVFLDDTDRFEPDTEYEVDDNRGYYFCRMGWAKNLDEEVESEEQPSEVDLNIHNASHKVKDSNG
jgi:hypothetical protein